MKKLLILGAGQYGLVAKEVAQAMGCYSEISFLDDRSDIAVGMLDDIDKIEYDEAFVAIGNVTLRTKLTQKIKNHATLIHPRSIVSPSAVIGDGVIIEAGAIICTGACIGKGTIVMSNAVVGHNAKVGDFCQLKYNCTVTDSTTVPDQTKLEYNTVYKF